MDGGLTGPLVHLRRQQGISHKRVDWVIREIAEMPGRSVFLLIAGQPGFSLTLVANLPELVQESSGRSRGHRIAISAGAKELWQKPQCTRHRLASIHRAGPPQPGNVQTYGDERSAPGLDYADRRQPLG